MKEHTAPANDSLNKLWSLILKERQDILVVVVYGIAVGVFSLAVPIAAQSLVNTVAFNSLLQPIVVLTTIVLVMLGLASILRVIQTAIVEVIQQRIFVRVSLDLAYRLPRLRMDTYDSARGTELVNRFFEVITVQKAAALMLLDGLAVALQAIIGLVLLAFYHPILLAFDVVLVFSMALVLWVPASRAVKTSIKESKAKYQVIAWLEEIARNPIVFKLSQGADYALQRADGVTKQYLLARKYHFKVLLQQISGTLLVQTVLSALLLGLGSVLVIKKQLTLGQLVAAEIVVTMVVSGFAKFGKYLEGYYDLAAAIDKLGALFDLPLEDSPDTHSPPAVKTNEVSRTEAYSVKLKDVQFTYPTITHEALDNISIEIKKYSKIGIYGSNASGKSTLLDIMIGLRQPTSGYVEIAEQDLRDQSHDWFRSHVALVRKVEIFDGTILENIQVGRPAVTLDVAKDALKKVDLLADISALPDGLQTSLAGSLNPLSAGQTQRLMLARALAGRPKLLLLDEALENIDGVTKAKILTMLVANDAPWTLVLASHDKTELQHCSMIYRLEQGHIELETASQKSGQTT